MKVIKTAVMSSGVTNALARIAAGDVDKTSPFEFTADDAAKILGPDKKAVAALASWHLGVGDNGNMYPFGKNGKVYRSALLAIRKQAALAEDENVYKRAGELLDKLDGRQILKSAPEMHQRAFSMFNVEKIYVGKDATADDNLDPALEDFYIVEGIATTPTPDRMDDIVEPDGCEYTLPLPYLWQHDSDAPIGNVVAVERKGDQTWSRSAIPKIDIPGNLKNRIDEAVQSIKLKLVRAQSIGFAPIEYAWMDNGGIHFIKWAWYELSAVTIPANMEATIATIKHFDAMRAKHGTQSTRKPVRLSSATKAAAALPTSREVKRYGQSYCDDAGAAMDEFISLRQKMME